MEVIEVKADGWQHQISDVIEPVAAFSNDGTLLAVPDWVSGNSHIVIYHNIMGSEKFIDLHHQGLGFRVWRVRVWGLGFRVWWVRV